MEEVKEGKDYSFPGTEEEILAYWDKIKAFEGQLEWTKDKKPYVFYDGPPFATGLPHYGHLLAGTIKDVVTRYYSTSGRYCPRRFGWDCHGLPVENEINKKLDIKGREGVLAMGIGKYNEECRSIVMRYSHDWEKTVKRAGRWIDFKNDYKTLNLEFMESVWWVFGEIYKQDLVYKGMKVMPYSWKLSTTISNNEASENYKEAIDPAITVSFPLDDDEHDAEIIAWTTTPWTLPSNLALCVHPDLTYVKIQDPKTKKVYIAGEYGVKEIPGAVQKTKGKKSDSDTPPTLQWPVLAKFTGKELKGKSYKPMFPYFEHLKATGAFRVVCDKYVSKGDGTEIVHNAPFFGEDDLRICLANGIIDPATMTRCPVDADGKFTSDIPEYAGRLIKQYDQGKEIKRGKETLMVYNASKENPDGDIVKKIKEMGRLVNEDKITHKVPFCPRSATPLIYKAVDSWFIKVEHLREKLWKNTAETYWVPEKVRDGRFKAWLECARDWAVSRSRFWGTPIPIWVSEDGEERVCVSSVKELEELTGTSEKVIDLHRHKIDHLTIPSKQGKGVLRRVEDVFDCWFESGSMPYGQMHYPFENRDFFDNGGFPADFVAEGIDQTRGWFYSLMVISTILRDQPAFKNLVCNGMVLAADGKKMSKSLRNYPDPVEILNEYGADAMRLYLITSPVVHGDNLAFNKLGVQEIIRSVFLPWYNAYRFLVQNVLRHQSETSSSFLPAQVKLSEASNALDRWIAASMRSLIAFVRNEMEAYRLYTVVPRLVKFIDSLTNVYVRYNRKRLKGGKSSEDCLFALTSLHTVLLDLCKLMAPFTPFFCEAIYQNLKKALPSGQPESVHWCSFPEGSTPQEGDEGIEASVDQMQRVIELARQIRERKTKPLKQPLKHLTIVHPDQKVLDALSGYLSEYIYQETNIRELDTCNDPEKFGVLKAEPVFSELGKRFKAEVPKLKKAIANLSRDEIVRYDQNQSLEVAGCQLQAGEMRVLNEFRAPEGTNPSDLDAATDGQLMAILDLRLDDSLAEEGLGREIVNRIQKLRKKAGLVPDDAVNVYIGMSDPLSSALQSQMESIGSTIGRIPKLLSQIASEEVRLASEKHSLSYSGNQEALEIVLTRPLPSCNFSEILKVVNNEKERAESIEAWIKSRDPVLLADLSRKGGGLVTFTLDQHPIKLRQNEHFTIS